MGIHIEGLVEQEVNVVGMTFGRFCQICPLRQKLRVCTEDGSDFIWIGEKRQLRVTTLNKQLVDWHSARVANRLSRWRLGDKNATWDLCEEALSDLKQWKPIAQRQIVDAYQGLLEPDNIVIKVTGIEGWESYNPPMTYNELDRRGAEELAIGIHRSVCTELTRAYEIVEEGIASKKYIREAKNTIPILEKWIHTNVYGFMSKPEAIIRACQKAARKNILDRQEGKKGYDVRRSEVREAGVVESDYPLGEGGDEEEA